MGNLYYYTNAAFGELHVTDGTTDTLLETVPGNATPDSLLVIGHLLYYTTVSPPQLRVFDLNTTVDTQIATSSTTGNWQDFVLDAGGLTMTISGPSQSIGGAGTIVRVTLSNGNVAILKTFSAGLDCRGLAYDPNGNLYVCVDSTSGPATTWVYRIDPSTGATITISSSFVGEFDGLCYDPVTGELWAAQGGGSSIQAFSVPALGTSTSATDSLHPLFDGIASIGDGFLYIADLFGKIVGYNISGNSFAQVASTPGIDDLWVVGSVPLSVSCGNPQPGTLGQSYSASPSASGGAGNYTYSITSGSLPPGLSMNSSTGAITGTPTATGAAPLYGFQITATDANNNSASVNCMIPVIFGQKYTELYLWQIEALPDAVFNWRSQLISHGMNGYQSIPEILATYSSVAPVTLSFKVFDGTAPANITLPSTNAIPQKILLRPTFNKFRLIQYAASSSQPFQINLPDWLVKVGEWGRQAEYQSYRFVGEG